MPSLRVTVYVTDDRGNVHRFRPGDEVPGWAAAKIRNPRVWAEPVSVPPVGEGDADGQGDEADAAPPPQGGAGSGRPVWAAYAEGHGVAFGDDDTRDDIIDACEQAGIPV